MVAHSFRARCTHVSLDPLVRHGQYPPMTEAATTQPPAAIATLSFEAAMEELGRIVRQLEEGRVPLDDAIVLYERATALKQHCDARLQVAEVKIEQIRLATDGSVTGATPFDAG